MEKCSEIVKLAGLKNLKKLADKSGIPEQTLIQWREKRAKCFRLMVLGATIDEFMNKIERFKKLA